MRLPPLALALALLLGALPAALAVPSGGSYTLRKQAMVPGGASVGGAMRVSATLAEPAAGVASGNGFRLTGGFQTPRPTAIDDALLADGFE